MDLRTCPACSQSVLDDDAEICPFCGAAMDGSSGSTKAPASTKSPKAIAREKAEKEAAEAKAKAKTQPAKAQKSADDDPFAVAPQQKTKAIPLRRKPTAKTTYRVVCPMCDTNGFATPAVAGKEVKCPNPQCLMPIFTAPEIKKEAPPPPKKSLITPLNLALFGILLVAIGGGVFYAFVLNEPQKKDEVPPFTPGGNTPIADNNQDPETPEPENNDPPPPPKISIPELQQEVLVAGVEAARQRDNNRSKDFCRILTASAYAERDELKQAFGQLEAFDNLSSGLNFMKIAPLCRVGWKHLQNNDRGAAEQVVNQAVEYSARIPETGIDAYAQPIALGTILIALGRTDDARKLLESRESVDNVPQAVARISMVIQDNTFDLARSFRWLPPVDLDSPVSFAVCYGATVRGYGEQALEWIRSLESPQRQSTCLAGYAAAMGMLPETSADEVVTQVDSFSNLPAIDRQRALGVLLQVVQLNSEGNSPAATSLQKRLTDAVAEQEQPAASKVPDLRGVYEGKFEEAPAETRLRMQVRLLLAKSLVNSGKLQDAWKQIQDALAETASMAPQQSEVATLINDVERNRDRIQSRLAKEYDISRSDLQRNAFNQYRKNARQISDAADQRYQQEVHILTMALDWGLAQPMHTEYQQAAAANNQSNFVQILETDLMAELIFALNDAGQMKDGQALAAKWGVDVNKTSALSSRRQLERLAQSGRGSEAFQFYNRNRGNLQSELLFLELSCLMAEQAQVGQVFDWIGLIPDPEQKELSYRLTSAQLTHRGLLRETWKASRTRNLSATDKCSLNLGLMEGLSTTDQYDPPAPPPEKKSGQEAAKPASVN